METLTGNKLNHNSSKYLGINLNRNVWGPDEETHKTLLRDMKDSLKMWRSCKDAESEDSIKMEILTKK